MADKKVDRVKEIKEKMEKHKEMLREIMEKTRNRKLGEEK